MATLRMSERTGMATMVGGGGGSEP